MNEELEKLILSGNIRKALEITHEDKLLPVFVPTYKNRKGAITNKLDKIPGEVHLFIYEDDRDNYPKEFPNNVTVHILTKNEFEELDIQWHTIIGKREYMLEYAKKNDFDKIIVIDDDKEFEAWIADIKKEVTNKKGKANLWDCFKLINRLSEPYEFGIAGFSAMELSVAHYNWKKIVNYRGYPTAAIIMNVKNFKNKDIHYKKGLISEDIAILIDCVDKGLSCLRYDFISYIESIKTADSKNSIASSQDKVNTIVMNYYAEYRDYAWIKYKESQKRLYAKINWDNIKSKTHIIHDDFHEALYNACKENDLEKVVNLLKYGLKKDFEEW